MENSQNWFKIIIAVAVLIVAVSVGYYFVVLPQIRESKLNDCLNKVEKSNSDYIITMEADGLNPFTPENQQSFQRERDDCFKQYPQN